MVNVLHTFCLCINRVPALVTAVLLISGEKMSDTIDSSFFYGKQQVTTNVEIIPPPSAT